jgi:16S rRNA (uracil1498-N3)-methyltransferase
MVHRFFVPPDSIHGQTIEFRPAQAHQIRDVLRLRPGERVVVLDNSTKEIDVELGRVERSGVSGRVLIERPAAGEPSTRVILYQALIKSDKFEWVLQKGTELGISAFVPIRTRRSVAAGVGAAKFERWKQIVQEAAEQSGRGKLPLLCSHLPLKVGLTQARTEGGLVLLPHGRESGRTLKQVLGATDPQTVHLFIGPEGGFAEDEIGDAAAVGAITISLGPRVLRAETAALVSAAAIFYERGDLSLA